MSTTKKSGRKGQEKSKKAGRLGEKANSFHGRVTEEMVGKLTRPRTVPDLFSGKAGAATGVLSTEMMRPKLTKLLLKVTVQRSLGPVQVLMSPESTVGELIDAALRQYSKECRRPVFQSLDSSGFELHYSQFSLESLKPDEKLIELGSRNFFLCPKQTATGQTGGSGGAGFGYGVTQSSSPSPSSSSSCSKEAGKATKSSVGWLRFMEFRL